MSPITTHVLDTSLGRPAAGVPVVLEAEAAKGDWSELCRGATGQDGRLALALPAGYRVKGAYRLTFDTAAYFRSRNIPVFYPQVAVVFAASDGEHYHIPLLLSPYGYSTYRGS